jgi:hypothetical protein
MIRCLAVCVLLASLALAQSTTTPAPSAPKPQSQGPAASNAPATPASQPADDSSALPPDAIVMTFPGLCDYDVSHKFTDPQCKTVVTRAQFDAIVQILHPASTPAGRRIVAGMYTEKLLQTQKALALGLDKTTPHFEERMEVRRLVFYAKKLNETFEQQDWKSVTDKEIEGYYHSHSEEFLSGSVDRIFLPRFPPDEKPGETLSADEKQKRQQEWDQKLKQEADSLRARAVAGEDFLTLQNEAYTFTGVGEVEGPKDVTLKGVRRKMFDPDQKSVMGLQPGEVSQPLYDETRGYCIFRMNTKSMMPLEKVAPEIHKAFQTERMKKDFAAVDKQATITYNDAYLGPAGTEEQNTSASNNGYIPPPGEADSNIAK